MWENSHTSIDTFKSYSSSGKRVSGKIAFVNPQDYKYVFIKHYYFKSFEEFCLKLKRGWPDSTEYFGLNMIFIIFKAIYIIIKSKKLIKQNG